ncbi:hypothetical protein [Staphylococcus equorum]|uniref:hypothetical protein n=2 Tax=Staphylococcus equorum TaxID=246432 RepID=UPI00085393B4|nr:hypothetical protein [Staphylococcus equorum]OEL08238.1 hypothetical protein AST04_08620 [Staphylococcus equorum]
MSEKQINNDAGQPNAIYGFKTNLRQKKYEVELRIDKVEKFNLNDYSIIPIRLIYGLLMFIAIVLGSFFFLASDVKRAMYLGVPLIVTDIGLVIIIVLYIFIYPSFGSLLGISVKLFQHLINSKQVKKGKKPRSKATGFAPTRKDGLVRYVDGHVGRYFYLDGKTSKTAYPYEVLQQEITASRYHNNRNRGTTETIITSSQKQNTERQSESLRALHETNDYDAVKDYINLNKRYVDEKIQGERTTFVQYLLMISPDEKTLNDSIDTLFASTAEGLYYNVKAFDKKETDQLLTEIKGLK